ncbi:MAG: hypothetical protein HQM09_02900 [Candidatus Riflebacteria bacterium]|nr:hypothetical protein [Candidatus Riflebacteria bacterium]
MAFRFEKSELVRQIAESAIDEAFAIFFSETKNINSEKFKFLFKHKKDSTLSFQLPIMEDFSPNSGDDLSFIASAMIIDFRDSDIYGNRLYPGEGVGTFQISVAAVLKQRTKIVAQCQITRHHDFRIISLVTSQKRKPYYATNFLLDYALFVRCGMREFQTSTPIKSSYNADNIQIVVRDQSQIPVEKRGKIFFGGTDIKKYLNDSPIFFNVAENFSQYQELFPKFVPKIIYTVPLSDCCNLFPSLRGFQNDLQGMTGVFEAQIGPIWKSQYSGAQGDYESKTKEGVKDALESFQCNTNPGVLQISDNGIMARDPAYAASILEGAIRQRFLYTVKFNLNLDNVGKISQSDKNKIKNDPAYKLFCLPIPKNPISNTNIKTFLTNLAQIDQRDAAKTLPLISRFEDNFLFTSKQQNFERRDGSEKDSYPSPQDFFRKDGGRMHPFDADFRPYAHGLLRSKTMDYFDIFKTSSVYDKAKGELNLRGITTVFDEVTFQGPNQGPVEFSGKGVIIADGFRILSGIKKKATAAPDDFCILYTRGGNITIDTTQEIEAGIMAVGDQGNVIVTKPLKLKGCLVVDYLQLENWANGKHTITYNPDLNRSSSEGDFFQIIPAPQITFQRITEDGT